jgi:serine protease Do
MNIGSTRVSQRSLRAGLAAVAGAVLITGATWSGLGADAQVAAAPLSQAAPVTAKPALAGGRDSYADIVKIAAPAVVTIRTEGRGRPSPTGMQDDDFLRRFFGDRFDRFDDFQGRPGPSRPTPRQRGLGSGVIVDASGYVLTNHHVVDGAERISVDLTDRRTVDATLVGSDKASDLAVLKIEAPNLQALPLGDSDAVAVGDVVLAVGNPLGIGQTVTMGIISAKGRSTGAGNGGYEDFLQTDAPINHGNSGGALVNTRGQLVGINSQIVSMSDGNIGIGFAIPANMARHVMDDLRNTGRVRRAQLGVTVQPVTSDMAESLGLKQVGGAIVSTVAPGSAADKAGVKRGDVIKAFNGRPVDDTNTLRNRVAEAAPGSVSKVTIVRDGADQELLVTLDEVAGDRLARRGGSAGDADQDRLGVAVAPLTPELASREGLPRDAKGLLIQDVDPDSRAATAGMEPRDVILEVNRQPVGTVEDLRAALRSSPDRPVLLLVRRDGRDRFVTVRPS